MRNSPPQATVCTASKLSIAWPRLKPGAGVAAIDPTLPRPLLQAGSCKELLCWQGVWPDASCAPEARRGRLQPAVLQDQAARIVVLQPQWAVQIDELRLTGDFQGRGDAQR